MGTNLTATEVAIALDGETHGDGNVELQGFASADKARKGDLTFAENGTYFAKACQSEASAIMVDTIFSESTKTLIKVPNARIGFAKALDLFFPNPSPTPGVHPSAVVHDSAKIDPTAYVGPQSAVGEGVSIGPHCVLHGGNHLGKDCSVGANSELFPNVIVYPRAQIGQRVRIHAGTVIGSDGFGYIFDEGQHRKIKQVGQVIIHDDVEIGSNVTIDRGALGSTTIGRGTKIDNLVQIAHNVTIGEHCLVIAQVGISGSTKLGNYVTLAGQAGLTAHLKIGNEVTVGAQSGVMHDIPSGGKYIGAPAQPDRKVKRQVLAIQQLPKLLRRVSLLEKELEELNRSRQTEDQAPTE